VLMASSLLSPFVRYVLGRGTDVAMNISSLGVRGNEHVKLPGNGSFMDAGDRAKPF
jgi:hypothetical protein